MIGFGVFEPPGGGAARAGARIGEDVVDLAALARAGGLPGVPDGVFEAPSLNAFMAAGPDAWAEALAALDDAGARLPLAQVRPRLPFAVADYADFYSSLDHALNLGRLFRPGAEPLPPNWRHLPLGYHGRAGTVVVSGTDVVRPCGQYLEDGAPSFGPSRSLDIELELGVVIGLPSTLGEPVPVASALDHVFGAVLLNDWSARDIQAWEYQPLGPFLGKSFCTSIGAWVTPLSLLLERRVAAPPQEPEPLPYLREEPWALDLDLTVELNGASVARTSARHLYWTMAQQIAHLTVNGASLRTGDLLGSGTISGTERSERGSLIELGWNGAEAIGLPDGSTRSFLEDGDSVVLRGTGLAEVAGRIAAR